MQKLIWRKGIKNLNFAQPMVTWVKLFSNASEASARLLHGRPQLCVLHGHRVCLVRFGSNFYAVQDSCSHNGESLSKGTVNHLGEIICPWHNYCFSLETGRELHNRSADLKIYPVKADDSGFYVGIF
ncbi:MAG: Rieske 2Fe-2S domain-containing protein [Cyclobacteriaceae bacterium]|nr:Rieske 2Fe-2S domain-containing protein [Cyclobacteriaceae bacterium]MCX7637677.1 Rieske 2Fe-2S domain-containing protein [Cyclobacteriaceae bacterium]MDW8331818.1 Rieske 2Fe-2S domain-containing protein [Cyclobacteriaceae bacterium]